MSFEGRVVRIIDGDTIEVLDASSTPQRIRLAGIDAPERGQPYGTRASRRLSQLVGGKTVTIDSHKRDRYQRLVAKIVVDAHDANLAMARAGAAWWYRRYASEQSAPDQMLYKTAEDRSAASV